MKTLSLKELAIVSLMILSFLILPGCKDNDSESPDSGTTGNDVTSQPPLQGRRPSEYQPSLADANAVAATVNGLEIKEGEINELIAPQLKAITSSQQAIMLGPEVMNENIKMLRDQGLHQLIVWALLEPQIEDSNIVVTTEEADKILQEQLMDGQAGIEEFNAVIAEYGQTYDDVVQLVKEELIRKRFLDALVAEKMEITDDEVKAFYSENESLFNVSEQIRASHILAEARKGEPNEVFQTAREKIEDIYEQVKEDANFAELARANSDCPSAAQGGDLGYFTKGRMVPEFENAAFGLEVGQVSDIVQTDFGYHIIKVTDHKEAGTLSFEEVEADIRQVLEDKKKASLEEAYIESLISEANIEFPQGKELKFGLFAP